MDNCIASPPLRGRLVADRSASAFAAEAGRVPAVNRPRRGAVRARGRSTARSLRPGGGPVTSGVLFRRDPADLRLDLADAFLKTHKHAAPRVGRSIDKFIILHNRRWFQLTLNRRGSRVGSDESVSAEARRLPRPRRRTDEPDAASEGGSMIDAPGPRAAADRVQVVNGRRFSIAPVPRWTRAGGSAPLVLAA